MKLKSISARNLKGLTFKLDLTSLNVLVGTNFAGKTARADAIRLLLLGYLPELGKRASDTFEICSGAELFVEGEFDNGVQISRRWWLKGDTVKSENNVVGTRETAANGEAIFEANDRFAVMLDAATYFALSDRDRVDYVFAHVPMAANGPTPAEIVFELQKSLIDPEGPPQKIVDGFVADLNRSKESHEHEARLGDAAFEWTAQAFLDHALEFADGEAKSARAANVAFDKTTQGLAHLRANEVVAEDAAVREAEVERVKKCLTEAQEEKARHLAAYDQGRANSNRREQLQRELRERGRFVTIKESLTYQLGTRRTELSALPKIEAREIVSLNDEREQARAAVRDHERDLFDAARSLERLNLELIEAGGRHSCPYCGTEGAGWKDKKLSEINSAISGLEVKRGQLQEALARVQQHERTLGSRIGEKNRQIAEFDEALRKITAMERDLEACERNLAAFLGKEDELARIPGADANAVAAVETAHTRINVATDRLRELEDARRKADGRKHDLVRLAEAEKARDEAKDVERVAKSAACELRKARARIVAETFQPLLRSANAICGSILKTPLEYHDGEIGSWREGVWVGHGTFSGTEKALAYAAIQAALTSTAPVRVVILDELGRLDDANVAKFVTAIKEAATAGLLDQFLGIDTGRAALYAGLQSIDGADLTVTAIQ